MPDPEVIIIGDLGIQGPPGPQGIKGDQGNPGPPGSGSTVGGISDVPGLQTALDSKTATTDPRLSDTRAPTAHTHPTSDVTGLDTSLAGKASTVHTHAQADVTGLTSALGAKADQTALTTGLAGKVDNSDTRLSDARTPTAHTHPTSDVTGLDTALTSKADAAVTTSALAGKVNTSDSRLTDARTPTDGSVTDAKIASTLSPTKITGTAVVNADTRLSDARTPTDASVTDAKIATTLSPSKITGTAVVTADARLSDARTPTAHTHPQSEVTGLTASLAGKATSNHPSMAISRMVGAGHSYMAGYQSTDAPHSYFGRIASMLHATPVNRGANGANLAVHNLNGFSKVLQDVTRTRTAAPYLGAEQLVMVDYGINDLQNTGSTAPGLAKIQGPLRLVLSRFLASSVIEGPSGTGLTLGGAGTWNTNADTTVNSGTGYQYNGTDGATVTYVTPADWPGGVVAFVHPAPAGVGSIWTYTVDGGAAGSIDTRSLSVGAGKHNGTCVRFTTGAGAHTIVATSSATTTFSYFDCVHLEATTGGPIVMVALPAYMISYSAYAGAPFPPVDADVDLLRAAVQSVVNEFPANVFTWDPNVALNKTTTLYNSTQDHPNDAGHAKLAAQAYKTLLASGMTVDNFALSSDSQPDLKTYTDSALALKADSSALTSGLAAKVDTSTYNAGIATKANTANAKGFVNHGATAGTARPTGYASIEWFGTVAPTNAVNGDTWVNST